MLQKKKYGFDGLFDEFERFFFELNEAIAHTIKTMPPTVGHTTNRPKVYAFSVEIAPDGTPQIKQFGNVLQAPLSIMHKAVRQPFIDILVDEKEKTLCLVAEMPGAAKEKIKVEANGNKIVLDAREGQNKYYTEVPLDRAIVPESATATYNNGIMAVKFRLQEPSRQRSKAIKVG